MYPHTDATTHVRVHGRMISTSASEPIAGMIQPFLKYLTSQPIWGSDIDCILPLGSGDRPRVSIDDVGGEARQLAFSLYPSGGEHIAAAHYPWPSEMLHFLGLRSITMSRLGPTLKPHVTFRGTATGPSTLRLVDNARVQAAHVSRQCPDTLDACLNEVYMRADLKGDAWSSAQKALSNFIGISYQRRHRRYPHVYLPDNTSVCPFINIFDAERFPVVLVIAGNGAPDRVISHLAAGQVIFRYTGDRGPQSGNPSSRVKLPNAANDGYAEFEGWAEQRDFFEALLVPHVHYVPLPSISCEALQRVWARYDGRDFRRIGREARRFYETFLSETTFRQALSLFMKELSTLQRRIVPKLVEAHNITQIFRRSDGSVAWPIHVDVSKPGS